MDYKQGRAGRVMQIAVGIVFSVVVAFAIMACADKSRSLSADLAFNFDCESGSHMALGYAIERFLKEQGFKQVDVVRVRRERNMKPMESNLFVDGIDAQQRMIRFMALPLTDRSFSVSFYSPPPTQRAEALEEAILAFVSNTLKCRLREVSRSKNDSEKRDYYNELFSQIEKRVRETKE